MNTQFITIDVDASDASNTLSPSDTIDNKPATKKLITISIPIYSILDIKTYNTGSNRCVVSFLDSTASTESNNEVIRTLVASEDIVSLTNRINSTISSMEGKPNWM